MVNAPDFTNAAANAANIAAGVTLAQLFPRPDVALLSGIICGALVFLLRSKESSRFKRFVYFCISLVGGYYLAPAAHDVFSWAPMWLAAFVTSSALVAIASIILDWAETGIPQLLNKLIDRFIGGKRNEPGN